MIRKVKINEKIMNVVSREEYERNPSSYVGLDYLIEMNGALYPIREFNANINSMGAYNLGPITIFKGNDDELYKSENIIDFEGNNIRDYIYAQDKLKSAERSILTSIDNIYTPNIQESDDAEMAALKDAIGSKQIDIDKYAPRFGPNFSNDKRLLKKSSITMSKLKSIANALDMKVTLTIEDKPDAVNPIGKVINVEITKGDNDNESESICI